MRSAKPVAILVVALACLAAGIIAGMHLPQAAAQPAAAPFAGVEVVSYASGLTGFFDQQTGNIYVYDSNLEECVLTRKLTRLGQRMETTR